MRGGGGDGRLPEQGRADRRARRLPRRDAPVRAPLRAARSRHAGREAIAEALNYPAREKFRARIERGESVEGAIDASDIPHVVGRWWRDVFSQEFADDRGAQNLMWVIRDARNRRRTAARATSPRRTCAPACTTSPTCCGASAGTRRRGASTPSSTRSARAPRRLPRRSDPGGRPGGRDSGGRRRTEASCGRGPGGRGPGGRLRRPTRRPRRRRVGGDRHDRRRGRRGVPRRRRTATSTGCCSNRGGWVINAGRNLTRAGRLVLHRSDLPLYGPGVPEPHHEGLHQVLLDRPQRAPGVGWSGSGAPPTFRPSCPFCNP